MTRYLLTILALTLTGCSAFQTTDDGKYGNSTQGIPVSQLDVEKLKIGMHKRKVADTIGHPPHINPFAPDTWTYTFTKNGQQDPDVLVLTFKNHKLVKIQRSPKS